MKLDMIIDSENAILEKPSVEELESEEFALAARIKVSRKRARLDEVITLMPEMMLCYNNRDGNRATVKGYYATHSKSDDIITFNAYVPKRAHRNTPTTRFEQSVEAFIDRLEEKGFEFLDGCYINKQVCVDKSIENPDLEELPKPTDEELSEHFVEYAALTTDKKDVQLPDTITVNPGWLNPHVWVGRNNETCEGYYAKAEKGKRVTTFRIYVSPHAIRKPEPSMKFENALKAFGKRLEQIGFTVYSHAYRSI